MAPRAQISVDDYTAKWIGSGLPDRAESAISALLDWKNLPFWVRVPKGKSEWLIKNLRI
jgi:hypothetical protein